ncbi:MAG: hypothetical protein P4L35_01980 [Ignavibacteriaceae bacterium]|nr:hypothetical protein [Ignavibacteriaceae bacterium]
MDHFNHDPGHLDTDHSMDHFNHDPSHLDNDHSIHTHISKHGEITGTSQKNIFGGKNYWDSHGAMKGFTMKNIFDGHDYYNSHGDHMGLTMAHHGNDNFLSQDGQFHHSPSFLQSDHINSARIGLLKNIR